ncbi:sigma-70 family RNA polymerase sigma factor [Methylobacillus gramineus]|uniref:sigma-70 family RNA polymerase sigma factor n=1 Tax=Methylobacillus gramineus TaxID=755169 RepID=UPI001CFFE704|nr:sigma-70 family RNA polymerase sigma factor [Methylobacillus gramineus]MCB5184766.1 sigma-70 family RNA polymerase sigma factor [Methylobacillus gramineus]
MQEQAISNSTAITVNAVGQLYVDHHHWLVCWLRKKLGSFHHADDVAHDTFLRVLLSPDTHILHAPKAYLAATATNLMIDAARRRKLEQAYLESLMLISEDQHEFSPEQYQEAIEVLSLLASMLSGLPDKPRRAFLMSRLEDLSYAEIADRLDVSVSMVKQYLAKVMVHCYALMHSAP